MHLMTDLGREQAYKVRYSALAQPSNITVGLYDDSVDDIQSGDDLAAITTIPTGNAYQDATVQTTDFVFEFVAGRWRVTGPNATFDVSDSSRNVDSFFFTDDFQAASDSSPTEHLTLTGALGDSIDLSIRSSYTIREYGEVDPS